MQVIGEGFPLAEFAAAVAAALVRPPHPAEDEEDKDTEVLHVLGEALESVLLFLRSGGSLDSPALRDTPEAAGARPPFLLALSDLVDREHLAMLIRLLNRLGPSARSATRGLYEMWFSMAAEALAVGIFGDGNEARARTRPTFEEIRMVVASTVLPRVANMAHRVFTDPQFGVPTEERPMENLVEAMGTPGGVGPNAPQQYRRARERVEAARSGVAARLADARRRLRAEVPPGTLDLIYARLGPAQAMAHHITSAASWRDVFRNGQLTAALSAGAAGWLSPNFGPQFARSRLLAPVEAVFMPERYWMHEARRLQHRVDRLERTKRSLDLLLEGH